MTKVPGERAALKTITRKNQLLTATFLAASASVIAFAPPAHAQDRVYTGPGTDWTSAGNWSGNDVPNSVGETAVFENNGAPANVLISSQIALGAVRFDASAPTRTIDISSVLAIGGSGFSNQSGTIQAISIDGAVAGSTTLQMIGSSDFTGGQTNVRVGNGYFQIAQQANATSAHAIMDGGFLAAQAADGTISLGALSGTAGSLVFATTSDGGAANQVLTVGGLNLSTTFAGSMVQNPGSVLNLVKAGTGTLTLTGFNSYGGTTTINGGTLQVGDGGVAGSVGTGNIINNATLTYNRLRSATLNNVISGTGALNQQLGRLTLGGANTYSGATTVSGGVLRVTNSGGLGTSAGGTSVASGAALELSGGISIGDALTLNGSGVANNGALSNVSGLNAVGGNISLGSATRINANGNSDFTDALNLNGTLAGGGHALTVGGSGRLHFWNTISDVASLSYDGTGVLFLGGANTFTGPINIGSGVLLTLGGASIGDNVGVAIHGSWQMAASETIGALQGSGSVILSMAGGATALTTGGNGGSTTFSGTIEQRTGVGSLIKEGAGTFILTGATSYSGTTTIRGGRLQIGNGGLVGTIAESGGAIDVQSGATLAFDRAGQLTIAPAISGRGRVVQQGTGTTFIAGVNSYSGGTVIHAGAVAIDNDAALGTGAITFTGSGTLRATDTLTLANPLSIDAGVVATFGAAAGQTLTLVGSNPGSGEPGFELDAAVPGGELRFGSATDTGTVMLGSRTSAITNLDNPVGLFVDGGTLRASGITLRFLIGLGLITTTVAAGATVDLANLNSTIRSLQGSGAVLNDGATTTVRNAAFAGSLAGTQNLSVIGSTVLTGANSYTGTTRVAGGAVLTLGNGGTSGSIASTAPITLSGGRLNINRADAVTLTNALIGNGSFAQVGGGTTSLAGTNTAGQNFTGTVFVDAGRLAIDGNFGDVVDNAARLVVGAGGTLGGSGTFFGDVDARNGMLAPGNSPGTLTVAGNLALGAGTILNFELGEAGTAGGPNNDLVVVGGNLTLDGTLNTIAGTPAYGPGYYRLFNYGGALTDNGLNIGSIAGGYTPTILTNISGQVNLLLDGGAGQTVQYWDGADTTGASTAVNGDGGSGAWNAAASNWTTPTGFGVNDAWRGQVAVLGGGSGGTVTVEGTQVFQDLRFETAGYTLQAGAGGALATTGGFSVIDVDAPLATVNVGISGNGGLTKTGAGTLVLGATSSYAGVTTVSEGVVRISASGSIGGAGVVNSAALDNAGTVNAGITNSGTLTSTGIINGALSNSGAASLAGQLNGELGNTGSVVLTGTTSGISTLTQDATGSVALAGFETSIGAIVGAGTIDLGSATLTTGGANGSTSFAGTITGTGALTKAGSGTLLLNGVSDYSGATTVADGTLQISSTGEIGGSAVMNNAALVNGGTIATGVVNTGSLASTGRIEGTLTNSGTASLSGQLGGDVANSGVIALTGTTTGIAALTQTADATFNLAGFSTTIASLGGAGTIQTGSSAGTVLTVGNTTSAQFAGTIAGSARLVKAGTAVLTLTGTNSFSGGTLISGGTLQLGDGGASGSIQGAVINDGTLTINRSDNIVFDNALAGSGRFVQAGAGTTTLSGTNGLTGGFEVSGGRLRGDAAAFGANAIRADATIEFSQGAAGTFGGAISGAGTFEKTGAGRLVLTGTSGFTGQTRLLAGELAVNGSLAQSTLTLAAGTRLSGAGAVGSVTVASGATIAPGNSIGTLTVNGDINFATGSTFEVEVDPSGTAADLIAASGRAILNGGSVVHIGFDGNYRPFTTYTILTATGGVQGTFSNVSSSFAFLDPTLGYSANAVTLTLARNDIDFSDVAVTINQGQVANGVEELSFGNPLFDTVLLLDENGARLAFDQLSGEIYPSLLAGMMQDSRFVRGAALERMRHFGAATEAEPGLRWWMQGLGSRGHLDGDGNSRRMKQDSAGLLLGIDAVAGETVQLGAFGGYQQGDASVRAAFSEADIASYHIGVYAGADLGALGLRAGYSFSWYNADVTRRIAFGGFSDVTSGKFDASTAQAFAEIGHRLDFGNARIEPFAQFAQIWGDSERMNERGGAAALQVARGKMSTTVSMLGTRLDQGFSLGSLDASLKLSAGWRHAFDDRLPVTSARFAGSSAFQIAGTPIARDAFAADVGISLYLSKRAQFELSYSGDVASSVESHAGRATFNWAF